MNDHFFAENGYTSMTSETLLYQTSRSASRDTATHLYLDLLKRCLVNWIYMDGDLLKRYFNRDKKFQSQLTFDFDPETRMTGSDWPENAHTMIGFKRLDNVQS